MAIYYDSDVTSIEKEGDNITGTPRAKHGTDKSSPSFENNIAKWVDNVNKGVKEDVDNNGEPNQESVKKFMANPADSAAVCTDVE